jgi:NAD(P)-dependent dehydrogenase (short-subunit alcohol dehydrogenase family)
MSPKTAYITGGAGGIGFAVAKALNQRGMRIVVADIDLSAAQEAVKKLQETSASGEQQHLAVGVDVSSWESQVAAFEKAIEAVGRLDVVIVNAGVGEKTFVPNDPRAQGFVKPNLDILEVDLNGFFYTSALAIQQMRRQEPGEDGLRGRSELES